MLCRCRVLLTLTGSGLARSAVLRAAEAATASQAAEGGGAPTVATPVSTSSAPSAAVKEDLIPYDLRKLTARAYFENPLIGLGVHHFAVGKITQRLSPEEYVVSLEDVNLSPIAEVSSRVFVRVGRTPTNPGRIIGGIVGKVNSDGTLGVLLDNNTFERQIRPDAVYLVEGRSRFTLEKDYLDMMEWFRDAGVKRHADRERICSMLYQRGWRENKLYLLKGPDVHCMTYIKQSVRMVVLEKAEWQRMHHEEMRALLRERVKEREWRYFVQKFSGFVSANWAGLGVMSVFLWNFKNFRKQQRAFQMKHAVNTLTHSTTSDKTERKQHFVERTTEENWARQILRQIDITRPRIAVLTGFRGCGKSSLFRTAVRKENKPVLFVEVRGSEDTLQCIVKSMKVPSVEACGDYLDFITDAFQKATKINGEPPVVVITLREGSELSRVYNETVVLACDRMLCHLVLEVALESLTMSSIALPRTDFYNVPNFTPRQAYQYSEHAIDPVAMEHFIEVVGTNSNDIDELIAAAHHRGVPYNEYTNQKLAKSMRQVQAAWVGNTKMREALKKLAEPAYHMGQHTGADAAVLGDPALKEIVLYDPVQDRWMFTHQVLHTATRCSL